MFGIIIGTACLIGLIKVLRRGSCGYGRLGPWGYGGGACGSWAGGPGGGACGGGAWDSGEEGPPWARRGGWGRGRGRGFGGWEGFGGWDGRAFFLRGLFEQLDTTPGQEKVIHEAIGEVRAEGAKWREELHRSRADIAKAMRSEGFDEVLLGELFARHDAALEALRKSTTGALAKVHAALDERQRARLAELIELGPAGFRRRRSYRDDL